MNPRLQRLLHSQGNIFFNNLRHYFGCFKKHVFSHPTQKSKLHNNYISIIILQPSNSLVVSLCFPLFSSNIISLTAQHLDLLTDTQHVCVCVCVLTVKLLLTFFVLDSATLASDRSTSSKIRDCRKGVRRRREKSGRSQDKNREKAQKRTGNEF